MIYERCVQKKGEYYRIRFFHRIFFIKWKSWLQDYIDVAEGCFRTAEYETKREAEARLKRHLEWIKAEKIGWQNVKCEGGVE